MMKIAALAAVCTAMTLAATADETPAACPEGAFQSLYVMRAGMSAGTVTDPNQVFNTASAAVSMCPEDHAVLGLSSTMFAMLADGLPNADPATRQRLLEDALKAAIANAEHFDGATAGTPVTYQDGSQQQVYMYNQVDFYLDKVVFPGLLGEQIKGNPQAIFSGEPLTECPYPHKQGRARIEAESLRDAVPKNFVGAHHRDKTGFAEVDARLAALADACLEEKITLTSARAWLNRTRAGGLLRNLDYGAYKGHEAEIVAEGLELLATARSLYNSLGNMETTQLGQKSLKEDRFAAAGALADTEQSFRDHLK